MNQQRSRRFKSIKEARLKETKEKDLYELVRKKLKSKGIKNLPFKEKKERFDYNCITPGTKFMDKVAKCLQYYIMERYVNHGPWKGLKILLSDSNVPGEGGN
jgi:5'-3' exoribonuclease 2